MKATILEGSVFDRLKDIEPGSVDVVCTSPPYIPEEDSLPAQLGFDWTGEPT